MAEKSLAGIRVIELGLYVALPLSGRILAGLGAEVIRVETNKALDEMAFIPYWSRGAGQPEFQAGKKRITLDVRLPQGLEVMSRLVKMSDVFMTNFRREVLARWGIDFPQLRAINPDIVILWQTGLGGVGPYGTYKCYGNLVQHVAGISMMSGFPGPVPAAINSSYSDYHCGVFNVLAIIGGLMRRRRTGKPTTAEVSILGSGAVTPGPALLDYQANKRLPPRPGNQDPYASPHGMYPCKGEDRYCAIAVFTDEEWQAFCKVIGDPTWSKDPKFSTLVGRLRNADELDELVARWTSQHTAEETMERMQKAGVPAGIVSKGQDLHDSAHLKERGFYKETKFYVAERGKPGMDWELGPPVTAWSEPVHLSETPWEFRDYSRVGEDNDYVYGQLLGMSPEEIQKLTDEGVFV